MCDLECVTVPNSSVAIIEKSGVASCDFRLLLFVVVASLTSSLGSAECFENLLVVLEVRSGVRTSFVGDDMVQAIP